MIYRTKKITVRLTDKEYAKLREMSEMAQKHRFKKEREFKKRVSEETENEDRKSTRLNSSH